MERLVTVHLQACWHKVQCQALVLFVNPQLVGANQPPLLMQSSTSDAALAELVQSSTW